MIQSAKPERHHLINTTRKIIRRSGELKEQANFHPGIGILATLPGTIFNKAPARGRAKFCHSLNVEKGIILEINIKGISPDPENLHILETAVMGSIHDPQTIRIRLSGINVEDYIPGLGNEESTIRNVLIPMEAIKILPVGVLHRNLLLESKAADSGFIEVFYQGIRIKMHPSTI